MKMTDSKGCGHTSVHNPSPVKLPPEYQELNSPEDIDVHQTEQNTRDQDNSDEWFEARKCRLTASNFGKVLKRKATPSEKFLSNLFCGKKSISAPSLDYGKRNESNAKAKYLETYPARHFHKCGLVINKEFCFLGATPDGIVCDDKRSGIAEVKCPYTARDYTVREASAKINNFCLEFDQTTQLLGLKKDHEYYAQVQGQLMITGTDFCDFIVYTKNDIHVNRILPDIPFMNLMLCKLAEFFKTYAKPFLDKQKAK